MSYYTNYTILMYGKNNDIKRIIGHIERYLEQSNSYEWFIKIIKSQLTINKHDLSTIKIKLNFGRNHDLVEDLINFLINTLLSTNLEINFQYGEIGEALEDIKQLFINNFDSHSYRLYIARDIIID